ncbi:CRISPR-associated endonuclease Cas2 [Candidatus Kaiserbacteria bacterium CG10_big_fil_rev_8_21_14_0_10_59_10]|uniref:CRISPR-associated endonuclease Cas2 n=1 Tax=Candidatus Kaiserbacteria bacterium CG10_big_fil_rev_8_21_14_0_10_59_10 TaxID=1974612 RepID=A0A2H0U8D3_9BACT|nr:MAG: CRISPR-associated endonuclease Cas2 [Candidatus Kaiserbacteria bacterium CG10_big_fil_rev_8_21_14_0_10_59_10]
MLKIAQERAVYRYRRKRAIERLKELEFVRVRGEKLSITSDGKGALGATVHQTLELLNAKAWDGKWRIVIFDIPERYRTLRNRIRALLKSAGFVQLQQSVWVFPHDCDELVQLMKEESHLAKYIVYGTLERVEGSDLLKRRFGIR